MASPLTSGDICDDLIEVADITYDLETTVVDRTQHMVGVSDGM